MIMEAGEKGTSTFDASAGAGALGSHQFLDDFALAYHLAVAERLRERPDTVIERARQNLNRWLEGDAVGLATVVLPEGWQERLVPLTDEAGKTHAYCLEVHDTCVRKLMAGREKDFTFIKELLNRGLADMETFISRAETISNMPQSDALRPRLERPEDYLKSARSSLDLRLLQRLITNLRSRPQ